MLRRLHDYEQLTVHATNGELGSIDDFLFDDGRWTVRYLVVGTGSLFGRRVAISPIAAAEPDWNARRLVLRLSRDRIREGPDLLTGPEVPRTREEEYATYYGYPAYWGGPGLWAWAGSPGALASTPPPEYPVPPGGEDPKTIAQHQYQLRSAANLRGAHLQASDGEIGHVDDLLIDVDSWKAPYLLIDTSNWPGGKSVLVPTAAVTTVNWATPRVHIDLPRARIKEAPVPDLNLPLDHATETALATYYGRDAGSDSASQVRGASRGSR